MKLSTILLLLLIICPSAQAQTRLRYVPAAADNPLKGLVPYDGDKRSMFPHSMEFFYLPLSELMKAPHEFDWSALELKLNQIASRRHQAVFRVWMEYPGHKEGIPEFLVSQGLEVTEWLDTNTDPFPRQTVRTPDYEDPRLLAALESFIAAFGKRYDGDPRIGFVTAGLLGTWGEWHTYPRTDLMPSKSVQTKVMDAYETAFRTTPILLRYPAGLNNFHYAPNHKRRFGYHDDSFAWATLNTGRPQDNWFFVPALQSSGIEALNRWKIAPIGGEIRPELWGQIFDDNPAREQAQNFSECVKQTHATWLMDSGMFEKKQSPQRIRNATREVQNMGYEFHITSADVSVDSGDVVVAAVIQNTGVAPFYYRWPVELVCLDVNSRELNTISTAFRIDEILPKQLRELKHRIQASMIGPNVHEIGVRVVNPLKNGLPLRFANEAALQTAEGVMRLGNTSRRAS